MESRPRARVNLEHAAGIDLPSRQIAQGCAPCNPRWRRHRAGRMGCQWSWAWGRQAGRSRRAERPAPSGRGHGRASVAGRDKTGCLCPRAPISPMRMEISFLCGAFAAFLHAMRSRCMVDDDGQVFVFRYSARRSCSSASGQRGGPARQACRRGWPANLRLGSFVGAYGVKRNIG